MKINKLSIFVILSIVYFIATIPLSKEVFKYCESYQTKIQDQVEILDVESRLLSGKEWGYALFGEKNDSTIDAAMVALRDAHDAYDRAIENSMLIVWISIIFLVLIIVISNK